MAMSWYRGSLDLGNIFKVIAFNKAFRKKHPEYFDPEGIIVFCGMQGAGKTISAVQYVQKLVERYPDVIVISNMEIRLPEHIQVFPWTGTDCFAKYKNKYAGVIFLIDEIHLEFNSLESKKMDSNIFTVVSQQRKQRVHIVGTSQVFTRIAKPFREQFRYAVACQTILKCIQINSLIDAKHAKEDKNGEIMCNSIKKFFWFHSPELYESYDTYAVMNRYREEWKG